MVMMQSILRHGKRAHFLFTKISLIVLMALIWFFRSVVIQFHHISLSWRVKAWSWTVQKIRKNYPSIDKDKPWWWISIPSNIHQVQEKILFLWHLLSFCGMDHDVLIFGQINQSTQWQQQYSSIIILSSSELGASCCLLAIFGTALWI